MKVAGAAAADTAPSTNDRRRVASRLLFAAVPVGVALCSVMFDVPRRGAAATGFSTALVAMWAGAGAVLSGHPGEKIGGAALGVALLGSVAAWAAAVARCDAGGSDLPQATVTIAALAGPIALALLPASAVHVLVRFVDRSRPRRRDLAVVYAIAATIGLLLWMARPGRPLWPVVLEAALGAVVVLAVWRRHHRGASQLERRRLRWLTWAVLAGAEVALWALLARLLWSWPTSGAAILGAAGMPVPLALILSASSRWRAGVDTLLRSTISLAGLTGLVVAVGLVMLAGMERVPTGRDRSVLGLSMLAAGLAAVVYVPMRAGLSRFANRLVYGSREPPDQVLQAFGRRLSRATPMDELLLQVAESLRETLTLDVAEIWAGSSGRLDRVVSVPDAPPASLSLGPAEEALVRRAGCTGPAWARVWLPELVANRGDAVLRAVPITHSGRLLGLIVVVRGDGVEPFDDKEEQVLSELARQLGLALHNVHLDSALRASVDELERRAAELQASRARIVAASDTARRDIERNLHDGAQQHLIGLMANLRLALQIGETDPRAATEMLEELGRGLQQAVQQLRVLAHGIYPPVLVQRGLAEALTAAATGPAVEVVADGSRRYPPEVEAAVYFCCVEALQNAGKYAGADARVVVRVWEEAGALQFEVTDDGTGFDLSGHHGGAGFTNMGDRVGAIGGRLAVDSAPGRGTRVSGRIPLTPAARPGTSTLP